MPVLYYIFISLKEVFQPQVPLRLPCYDFTLVIGCIITRNVYNDTQLSTSIVVHLFISNIANSRGVTGGVYKTQEHIHRGVLIHDY